MEGTCFRCVEEGTLLPGADSSGREAMQLCLRHALHLLEELRRRFETGGSIAGTRTA